MRGAFPILRYLLKAHLDFLMMTGLLFVFFLVFEIYASGLRWPLWWR